MRTRCFRVANAQPGQFAFRHSLRRSAEHEYVPRLPRSAWRAAGPKSPRRGTRHARRARLASERAGEFAVRPEKLFLPRPAEGIPDIHVRVAPRNGRMARDPA